MVIGAVAASPVEGERSGATAVVPTHDRHMVDETVLVLHGNSVVVTPTSVS